MEWEKEPCSAWDQDEQLAQWSIARESAAEEQPLSEAQEPEAEP